MKRRERIIRRFGLGTLPRPEPHRTGGDEDIHPVRDHAPRTPLIQLGEHDVQKHDRRGESQGDAEHRKNMNPPPLSRWATHAQKPEREHAVINQAHKRDRNVSARRVLARKLRRPIAPRALQDSGTIRPAGFGLVRAARGKPRRSRRLPHMLAQQVVADYGREHGRQYREDLRISEFHENT